MRSLALDPGMWNHVIISFFQIIILTISNQRLSMAIQSHRHSMSEPESLSFHSTLFHKKSARMKTKKHIKTLESESDS